MKDVECKGVQPPAHGEEQGSLLPAAVLETGRQPPRLLWGAASEGLVQPCQSDLGIISGKRSCGEASGKEQ